MGWGCGRRRRRKISREIFLLLLLLFDGGRRILIRLRRDFPSGLLLLCSVFPNTSSGNLRLLGKIQSFNFNISVCKLQIWISISKFESILRTSSRKARQQGELEEIEDSIEALASKVSQAKCRQHTQSQSSVGRCDKLGSSGGAKSRPHGQLPSLPGSKVNTALENFQWKSSCQSFFGSK